MTVGLHFTSCRALQPYVCKKEGEKSARYFPGRNSTRDKNISEITDKLHPAGVCFCLY